MSSLVLEKVLRYAYFNGYTCIQWADPVKQCLQQSEQDSSQDLCDLLLTHVFSTARVHNILLESYLTYALTGESQLTKQGTVIDDSKSLINGKLFLSRLLARDVRFAATHEYNYQWACILNILPSLLVDVDGDRKEHLTWAPILSRLLVTLSHIVAVGLYPERKSSTTNPQHLQYDDLDGSDQERDPDDTEHQQMPFEDLSASQQMDLSLTNNTTQMAMDSQMTFDPDATLDFDATQPDSFDGQDTNEDGGDGDLVLGTSTTATSTDGGFQSHQKNFLTSTAAQQHTSQTSSLYTNTCSGSSSTKVNLDWDNAISAARIIIDLIEKKGAKRIIDKYEQGQKERELDDTSNTALETIDPWVTCHEILVPGDQKPSSTSTSNTHNVYIQKLLLLVERLTDRDLERRLAVHMKYHELEDEGTARAMPSAGLMGLVYHMVQIRPALDDEDLVNRLVKLQAIKGSFDESFYLELWFTALTGLREASFSTSCQSNVTPKNAMDTEDSNDFNICNTTVATNRLLWKNLVLVKLPHLINQLQERKAKEELANYSLKRDTHQKSSSQKNESNAIESSLMELKTFTGLLNACSPPACCSEFYVPSSKSSKLVNQFAFGNGNGDPQQISSAMEDNDDDSMMHIIDDMGFTSSTDFNTSTFIKAIRSVSSDDIFTSIIHSCRPYDFLRDDKIDTLLNSTEHNVAKETAIDSNPIKSEYDDNNDDMDIFINNELKHEDDYPSSSLFDDDLNMTKLNDCAQHDEKDGKPDTLIQIEQNIDERMNAIRSNVTQSSISELIHIGLVSLIYWRKIVDFILNLLQEKAQIGDVQTLSRICDALDECPSAIDLILQLYHPSVLLSPLESICNDWNPSEDYIDMDDGASGSNENEDDDDMGGIQNWYFKFGKIWMFVLVVANKFDIARNINDVFKIEDGLCYQFFITGDVIYGVHVHDEQVEELVGRWLSAMGGDGISDDLLRTTKLQMLLRATPTIIDRLLCIYDSGQIDIETFTGVLSYFRRRFLRFVLVPRVTDILCGELLNQNPSTALTCMSHLLLNQPLPDTLIGLCGNTILGSLRTWMECQRQHRKLMGNKIKSNISDMQQQQQQQIPNEDDNQAKALEQFFMNKLDLDDEQHVSFPETVSNGVTRRTLLEKAREMFRYIVKSGRSMYMNDVDGDAKTLWEPVVNSKPPKQVVSHYLDLVMFQAALKMGGIHWFISMIVDEVLEAGKSGGAVRAAELGSCLLTTPLTYNAHGSSVCLSMLRCLLQDVIPSSINYCFNKNTSFFQGQTLGVFTSDCLVLMYNSTVDLVDEIGDKFFRALVIDRVRGGDVSSLQMVPQSSEDGTRFAPWNEEVVGSPVWRGFVKGLMSNPFIKEMWPGAYGS